MVCRETHKPNPFPYSKAWIDQIGNFDYIDTISSLIIQLIKLEAVGIFNVGTELKSIYELANKTISATPVLKPNNVPSDTSMNLNKLHNTL